MAVKSIVQQEQERKARGKAIAARNNVLELGCGWSVLGDSHRVYFVTFRTPTYAAPALYGCTCTDYARHAQQLTCKHGWAVEQFRTQQARTIEALYAQSAVPSPAMEMGRAA